MDTETILESKESSLAPEWQKFLDSLPVYTAGILKPTSPDERKFATGIRLDKTGYVVSTVWREDGHTLETMMFPHHIPNFLYQEFSRNYADAVRRHYELVGYVLGVVDFYQKTNERKDEAKINAFLKSQLDPDPA